MIFSNVGPIKRLLIGWAAVLFLFPVGYWPLYKNEQSALRSRDELRVKLADAEERLRVASLQSRLGLILIEVEHGNFGKTEERSTKFFDPVRAAFIASRGESVKRSLEAVLSHRDEITASLTGQKPGSTELGKATFRALKRVASAGPPRVRFAWRAEVSAFRSEDPKRTSSCWL